MGMGTGYEDGTLRKSVFDLTHWGRIRMEGMDRNGDPTGGSLSLICLSHVQIKCQIAFGWTNLCSGLGAGGGRGGSC